MVEQQIKIPYKDEDRRPAGLVWRYNMIMDEMLKVAPQIVTPYVN